MTSRRACFAAFLLLGAANYGWAQPFQCAPGCTDKGNCNPETGECMCPYGWTGSACEVDELSACRLAPDSPALCGWLTAKSCECYRQCQRFHARGMDEWEIKDIPPEKKGCFMRDGLPPEQQTSKAPEPGEAVQYFTDWKDDTSVVDLKNASAVTAVMREGNTETLPLSRCPASCSHRGFCTLYWEDANAKPRCFCLRGFAGEACEQQENICFLKCNGHGTCTDRFCHCEKGWFSLGCSRNQSVPHAFSRNPADFKIYVYELPTKIAYFYQFLVGSTRDEVGSGLFSAWMQFLEQLLTSSVRTDNPEEAHLFYVPALTFTYSRETTDGNQHLRFVIDYIRQQYHYWNRTGGKDHVIWQGQVRKSMAAGVCGRGFSWLLYERAQHGPGSNTTQPTSPHFTNLPQDRGSCHLEGLAKDAIKLTHFGYYNPDPKSSTMATVQAFGADGYSCYHPMRDVVAVPQDSRHRDMAQANQKLSIDDILASKAKLLFFSGSGVGYAEEYSGNSRQTLFKLVEQWNDTAFSLWDKQVKTPHSYEEAHREAKFCFTPYGWGWGIRLAQAMVANCVPIIIQERVFQPYEGLLPYETFSLRLSNADLPRLREILASISSEQYRSMMQQLVKYQGAFHWYNEQGGRAFDYTVAALRRRYMNMKALLY